jgi:hypothetical protein
VLLVLLLNLVMQYFPAFLDQMATLDVKVVAMESLDTREVDKVRNQRLLQIQQQHVQLLDFLKYDLSRTQMEQSHLYKHL